MGTFPNGQISTPIPIRVDRALIQQNPKDIGDMTGEKLDAGSPEGRSTDRRNNARTREYPAPAGSAGRPPGDIVRGLVDLDQ